MKDSAGGDGMSQDWLKIEKATSGKPEVRKIASELGITRQEVFGRIFDVWCYFDSNSTDGNVPHCERTVIDDIAGLPGFALAMVSVGWLTERRGLLSLPNFDRHNGESSKRRSLQSLRMARLRTRRDATNVTGSSQSASPEESRGEENTPQSPPEGGDRKSVV